MQGLSAGLVNGEIIEVHECFVIYMNDNLTFLFV
jgi:hypothetical protein